MDLRTTYVLVSVTGLIMDKIFYMKYQDRLEARKNFNIIDDFKRTQPTDIQKRINLHLWGDFEISMLKIEHDIIEAPDAEWIINQCKLLTHDPI